MAYADAALRITARSRSREKNLLHTPHTLQFKASFATINIYFSCTRAYFISDKVNRKSPSFSRSLLPSVLC